MTIFYIVVLVPLLLYLAAFIYETFLSFKRLRNPKKGRAGYVGGAWELLILLLLFCALVMLVTFTQDLIRLADTLFWTTFIAAIALGLRAVAYLYIFYGRANQYKINWMDWTFAFMHLIAAVFLVITAVNAMLFIWQNNPVANTQFFPIFIPGLALLIAVCIIPMVVLYKTKA